MATAPDYLTAPDDQTAGSEAMPDNELVAILSAHEAEAIGYEPGGDDDISAQQERALNYYYGIMDDLPAQDGSSSAVDMTVATIVDAALAAVLKPFVSSDETVRFSPRGPEDVEYAAQATEYVNYIFNCDNPGFQITHDWFKDALLTKLGIVKGWWEAETKIDGLQEVALTGDPMQDAMLRGRPDYLGEENGVATFGTVIDDGRVKIENVPPEEFRVSRLSRSTERAVYLAHVPSSIRRYDLVEMGFDPEIVETLPAYGEEGDSTLADARYRDEGGDSADMLSAHKSQDRIALRDEYVRIDYDGDGLAELRRVMRVGNTILLNEQVDDHPFATLCPIPMPHKVYGLSLGDVAIEPQKISTVLLRQALDNLYKSNNPRPVIGEGAWLDDGSTADSLEDNAPGAGILVKDSNQFRFDGVPFTAGNAFEMLSYMEQQTEQRSGVSQSGQGLDSNALRKSGQMTATEMAMMQGAKNARVEMIARIFAETGVKRLFKMVLGLVSKHQNKSRVIRLRNKWVEMDPAGWPEFDVSISVGLGVGEKSEQIMQADAILQTMAELGQTPFATLIDQTRVYNAVKRKFNAAGVKDVDEYLIAPEELEQQPEQPSPEQMKAQADAQMQAAKMQHEQAMAEMRLQLSVQEQEQKQALAREQAEFEARLATEKAGAEATLARQKMELEAELALHKMRIEAAIAEERAEAAEHQNSMSEQDGMDEQDDLPTNRPGGSLSE